MRTPLGVILPCTGLAFKKFRFVSMMCGTINVFYTNFVTTSEES